MADTFESGGFNVGAVLLIGYSLISTIYEHLTTQVVNDWLQILLAIGGGVFLFFKIKNSVLDAKIKKKQLSKDEDSKNN